MKTARFHQRFIDPMYPGVKIKVWRGIDIRSHPCEGVGIIGLRRLTERAGPWSRRIGPSAGRGSVRALSIRQV